MNTAQMLMMALEQKAKDVLKEMDILVEATPDGMSMKRQLLEIRSSMRHYREDLTVIREIVELNPELFAD